MIACNKILAISIIFILVLLAIIIILIYLLQTSFKNSNKNLFRTVYKENLEEKGPWNLPIPGSNKRNFVWNNPSNPTLQLSQYEYQNEILGQ